MCEPASPRASLPGFGLARAILLRYRAMWPLAKIVADLAPVAGARAVAAHLAALADGLERVP